MLPLRHRHHRRHHHHLLLLLRLFAFFVATAAGDTVFSYSADSPAASTSQVSQDTAASTISYKSPISFTAPAPSFSTAFIYSFPGAATSRLSFSLRHSSSGIDTVEGSLAVHLLVTPNGGPSASSVAIHLQEKVLAESSSILSDSLVAGDIPGMLHCLIDYDGAVKKIQVKLTTSPDAGESSSGETEILTYPVDLSKFLLKGEMLVGITTDSMKVHSWSFSVKHGSVHHNAAHSEPLDPSSFAGAGQSAHETRHPSSWVLVPAIVFAAAAFGLLLLYYTLRSGQRAADTAEHLSPNSEAGYQRIQVVEQDGAMNIFELEDWR